MDRLDLALEASNEGIWDWCFETDTQDFTGRVSEFFEYPDGAVPNFFEEPQWVHEEDREEFFEAIRRVKAGESIMLAVEPRLLCDGEVWKWFRIRGVPVLHDGHLTGLAGSIIDITRRKTAEQQLLEERHLTQTLVDNVPLQIYFKDLKSRFTMVNKSMIRWLRVESPNELLGKTDADFFGEEHAGQAFEDEQRILETGEPMKSVIEKETWSGREDTWVLTTKLPFRNRRGELKGTFGVSSDVSELVRTQRSLAEMAAELQARNEAYEEEMALAREIQQGLLPRTYPQINGASFGHRYLPISGLAGDFFEVLDLEDDRVGLLICDVMGHGVRSALVASLLRGLVTQAEKKRLKPGAFLESLNKGLVAFLQKAKVTMFATAFYIVIDFRNRKIRYASAGHPAGIMTGGGKAALLPLGGRGKGPGLGLLPDASYGELSVPLEGVDHLLLFTDGIYEVENESGEAFLQNRLVKTVREAGQQDLEGLLDHVLESVQKFAVDGEFDDDVCLLGMSMGE
ncbi:MAG: SpoIIE family protein phosphatase [Verrucomicrobiota bacterium JB023]|nr:SpoIIE family protein phosphatase [Verrucomicrobiota bacterium JB023]